jgi:hypothetical protein
VSKNGPFTPVGAPTSPAFIDTGVTHGHAYLYQVCVAGGAGACASPYSNVAMGAAYTFADDPIITANDDPTG